MGPSKNNLVREFWRNHSSPDRLQYPAQSRQYLYEMLTIPDLGNEEWKTIAGEFADRLADKPLSLTVLVLTAMTISMEMLGIDNWWLRLDVLPIGLSSFTKLMEREGKGVYVPEEVVRDIIDFFIDYARGSMVNRFDA